MLWPIIALLVSGVAVALFLKWYFQAPSPPGNTPNPKLVAMFNQRLSAALDALTPAHSRGLTPQAMGSATSFLAQVKEVTQHCNYQAHVALHNRVVFDLTLNDGSVIKDLYAGGLRCPTPDLPGVPIMRVRFAQGRAVEISTDGSERNALPAAIVPALDSLIKHLIRYDQGLRPGAYYVGSPTTSELQQAWADPSASAAVKAPTTSGSAPPTPRQ